ncbi:hypothetical protein ACGF13_20720 [Kitasatospora sp. NPDC048286]|uniref:hypothetical protein n=1 Tax=Kitasatospora sp. NPDC048286 TaxID=3364047 RepID=UPI003723E7F1
MILQPETDDLGAYLVADEVIDHQHSELRRLAAELATPEAALVRALAQAMPGRFGYDYLPAELPGEASASLA